ncbi:AAA family ATPase [Deinococcus sp. HMF7620]|uniref:AAA family ATPase n=1 Tax=Deinococcus arboris TaxID=2682977 RepID=A0A7C9M8Y3_9DEIO|nr:AAA family ATPase [Deinococcus arboris]MVN89005.1 AAA family ATPase [Deinococcus arboris]
MTPAPFWQLHLLGAPRLIRPGGLSVPLDGAALVLLAYLALEGPTTRSRLARLLWPDTPERGARNNLVHLVRRLARTHGDGLVLAGDLLALASEVQVDVHALQQPALHAAGEAPAPGLLLAGTEVDAQEELADWLLIWRERAERLWAERLLNEAQRQEDAGDFAAAGLSTQRLLELSPTSEEAWRRLMRLQYLAGDRGAALTSFERCRAVIQREFGVEPAPETAALAQEIERGAPVAVPAVPARPRLPLAVRRPPRLVGREAEWRQLDDAWAAGQVILLSGEAGVGKSRLAHDFARSRGEVLTLEGRPGDATVPYATTTRSLRRILARTPGLPLEPWTRRCLARLLPELGGPEDPQLDRPDDRLHEAIAYVFRAGLDGVSALVYDDLHLADRASVEATFVLISNHFPLGQPGGVPRLIGTLRPAEVASDTLDLFRRSAAASHHRTLDLAPLRPEAVGQLVGDLDVPELQTQGAALAQFTGGNPLFILETVKHMLASSALDGPLPVTEQASSLIAHRLTRLSAAALAAARAAAVLQSDLQIELVAAVLGAPVLDTAAAWEELEEAQVMVGERFAHDLVQETVLAGLTEAVRRLLNRSAARVLESEGNAAPARIAGHWQVGGDEARAAPWLLRAAEAARRQGRLGEAVAFGEQAAASFEAAGNSDGAFEAATVALRLAAAVAVPGLFHRLGLLLHRLAHTPQQAVRAYEAQLRDLFEQGDWPGLHALAEATLTQATGASDHRLQTVCHEALAAEALLHGDLTAARHHLTQLGTLATTLGDPDLQASVHLGLGRVLSVTHRQTALAEFDRALALYTELNDHTGQVAALARMAWLQQELGRAQLALRLAQQAQDTLTQLDTPSQLLFTAAHAQALAQHALGLWAGALETLNAALTSPVIVRTWWLSILQLDLARLYLTLGAPARSLKELDDLEARGDLVGHDQPRVLLTRAEVLTALGQPEEARALLEAALARPVSHPDPFEQGRLLLALTRVVAPAQALDSATAALTLAHDAKLGGLEVLALTRRAQAHLDLGDGAAALEDSRAALDLSAALTPEEPLGDLLDVYARALEHTGDEAAAEGREQAQAWWQAALAQVPGPFRQEFAARHALTL